ncbi:macro domain-containing protein [Cryptosporangium arvum]|uniref:Thoeris protein ThsA Macro domain-containing protein n=1 Tax=Cryptosporangium arvum DSM 44712 TaxID=927661 RepID=A0A010Z167_9ACTN|nr:macro domain-containing protein [Cryptosporangium arvum]EXG81173.1 hypothetical protein CryarDRAFT_2280 [Cryptosporangium arvum DSM 44712]
MTRLPRLVRGVLGTRRGLQAFAVHTLVAFGLVSAVLQFVGQFTSGPLPQPVGLILASLVVCLLWGWWQALPPRRIVHEFRRPDTSVVIEVGDLLDQECAIVVGFTDTFATRVGPGGIAASSLQGQLLERRYDGDADRLTAELGDALPEAGPSARYPIGTVAVLGGGPFPVYAVAYSRLDGSGIARATLLGLWLSLGRLWESLDRNAERAPVAMPIIGSGLARVDALDQESLLKMILLSFVARSRQGVVSRELRVVIDPRSQHRVDLREVAAFLKTL